jgi:hypothetical protein
MKRRHYVLIAGLAVAVFLIAIFYFSSKQPSASEEKNPSIAAPTSKEIQSPGTTFVVPSAPDPALPNVGAAQQQIQERRWDAVFAHAVNFYGKVVDENGTPIQGASVHYSVPSNLLQIGKGTIEGPMTDVNGLFSITGKTGAGITVIVAHSDFYSTDQSAKQFSYFRETERNPSASDPAVFVLRKKGVAEPLLKLKQVLRNMPKDGRTVQVGLTGEKAADVTVQAWTSPRPAGAANNAPFAWKVRVEVPGGGLVANADQFQFEAPENGYAPAVEYEMPASGIDGKWRDRFEQTYFVKLGNGDYARMRFQMIAGGNHFAVVESYYNPSGSRNLEYDPNLTAQK